MTDVEKLLADAHFKLVKMLSDRLDNDTITDKEMTVLLGLLKNSHVTAALESDDMEVLKTHIPEEFIRDFDNEFKENGGGAYN